MPNLSLQQSQVQTQTMSQMQLQSLAMLSLGSQDLREAIYKEAEENPALEITLDKLASGADVKRVRGSLEHIRESKTLSLAAQQASDSFEAVLEAQEDYRQSLSEHLLEQFNTLHLTSAEQNLGEKLIYNLDSKGFHILAPESLLDKADSTQTPALLKKCLKIIQGLDPVGTCTKNVQESLYVQAVQTGKASKASLFILDGHLDFLDPPISAKVLGKIKKHQENLKKMFGLDKKNEEYKNLELDAEDIDEAIEFIKTLDPYPARDYSSTQTVYITPDVYVERVNVYNMEENVPLPQKERLVIPKKDATKAFSDIIQIGSSAWRVRMASDALPELSINNNYVNLASYGSKESAKAEYKKQMTANVQKAKIFIENIEFRKSTIEIVCRIIVRLQHKFFENGPGNLVPLKQQDIADELGVNSSTISRMANGKYLQCDWGLFEIKYFFPQAVNANAGSEEKSVTQDVVINRIKDILDEHSKNSTKKLSDQKIADILEKEGIHIARRTVAKYRNKIK